MRLEHQLLRRWTAAGRDEDEQISRSAVVAVHGDRHTTTPGAVDGVAAPHKFGIRSAARIAAQSVHRDGVTPDVLSSGVRLGPAVNGP
jgi:hypothetical protein